MHTVELLLDGGLEDGVREMWSRLAEAGRPSLANHRHPTNRPHLTVVRAASLEGLPALPLPQEATLGDVCMLGRALVRLVTPTPALRRLHAAAWSALPDPWPPPADWIPHVSLALNVPPADREAALALLGSPPPEQGHFIAARTYDTDTRTIRALPR